MIAIVSDIHANIEALNAVMEDIAAREVEGIACLGDIVGYGPNPRECVELAASQFSFTMMGNHEEGVLSEAGCRNFTPRAKSAVEWTRKRLAGEDGKAAMAYIRTLKDTREEEDVLFLHGSPLRPTRDYVFPKDVRNRKKLQQMFDRITRVCFVGHTHLPGVFTDDFKFVPPAEFFNIYMLDERKAMVNVGSVGQPRDGDNRASYVTFEEDAVVFRRVEYDYAATMRKIRAVKPLSDSLADRLEKGL